MKIQSNIDEIAADILKSAKEGNFPFMTYETSLEIDDWLDKNRKGIFSFEEKLSIIRSVILEIYPKIELIDDVNDKIFFLHTYLQVNY